VALAERLAFEQALSSLSTTFGSVSAGAFDREVQRAIRRIVDAVDIDRALLIEFVRGGGAGRAWATDGGAHADAYPWMLGKVRQGEVVALTRIDELPEEAVVDRGSWRADGIASQSALPLLMGGTVVGALVVSTVHRERTWERDGLLRALQLVAEVFASALARQQVDHEMQRLRQELAHIGRVSAMGELTASLAHELNQPLTAILNNAQVAQRFLDADVLDIGEMREILSDIVADDKRAADVIRRLRLLLKKGDLEYASLDLNDVVTEVARLLMNDAAIRNVAIRLDLAPALPRVRGDRVQLQQVLLNLVLNGLDAMRGDVLGDRDLVIRTFGEGTAAAGVAVQDAGPGIADQHAARIFEPLYTTKADGIGMGLAITRTIVDAHGGHVRADNNADGGATFQFTLPAERVAS
jgi:signal transduction histidine kinase